MRVAVGDAVCCHQASGVFQGLQNVRHGFPNVQSAEQGKVCGIRAVALHRVQDVVIRQAVCDAGVEVIHTVSRRAVNNTGAVGVGGVIGQVHRCGACVSCIHMSQGVMEFNQIQRLTLASRYGFAAELPAL